MVLKIKKFFTFFFFVLLLTNSHAENLAYIDIEYIMNNSFAGKSISNNLKKTLEVNNENFKKTEEDLKKKENQLISQKNVLNEEKYKIKIDALRKEIMIYQASKKKFLKEFNLKKIESTKLLLSKINPILADFSKEKSIGIILQKKNIVIGKSNLDITNDIIEILNKKLKKIEIN